MNCKCGLFCLEVKRSEKRWKLLKKRETDRPALRRQKKFRTTVELSLFASVPGSRRIQSKSREKATNKNKKAGIKHEPNARVQIEVLWLAQAEEPHGAGCRNGLAQCGAIVRWCAADWLPIGSWEARCGLQYVAFGASFRPGDHQIAIRSARSW